MDVYFLYVARYALTVGNVAYLACREVIFWEFSLETREVVTYGGLRLVGVVWCVVLSSAKWGSNTLC